jgi:glycosyltransferase 2 family protein
VQVESIKTTRPNPRLDVRDESVSSLDQAGMAEMLAPGNDIDGPRLLKPFTKLLSLPDSVKFKLKIAVSVLMFGSLFLLGKFDLSKSWEAAKNADLRFVVAAVVLFLLSTFLNAFRWKLLAAAVGLDRPLLRMAQYSFVGLFFNMFLPSTVGGDVSRCYYLSKGTHHYKRAFYSVMADRVIGVSVLFLFASTGLLLGPGGGSLPWQLRVPIFVGTLGIFCLLPMAPRLARAVLGPENAFYNRLNNSAIMIYWRDKGLVFKSLCLSVLLQVIIVVCHILLGLALGLTHIPLWYYFVFYPSVAVLGFVTPSFNGIGIREWAYTYFLGLAHVENSMALTYAIMWLGLISLSSLVGGLVYLAGHFTFSESEVEQAQHEEEDEEAKAE